jgi:hypothetical protein
MKFSVIGVDKNTGQERTVVISASNEKNAEEQARKYGLLVSSVIRRDDMSETVVSRRDNQPAPPFLSTDDENVADWLKPVPDQPLTFETVGVGRPGEMTLIPLYAVMHERYTVYWKMGTP